MLEDIQTVHLNPGPRSKYASGGLISWANGSAEMVAKTPAALSEAKWPKCEQLQSADLESKSSGHPLLTEVAPGQIYGHPVNND